MSLLEAMLDSNGGAVGEIAKRFGLPNAVAQQAVSALTPALARALQRNTAQPGGIDSLIGALGSGKHQQYVDHPETLGEDASIADGNAILGHILGSKDVSRNVAGAAAQQTGLSTDVLKQMLPMVATVAMGALAKQTNRGSQLAGATGSGAQGDPLSLLSGLLGGGSADSSTDDLLNLAKKFF